MSLLDRQWHRDGKLTNQLDQVLDVVLLADEVVEIPAAVLDACLQHLPGSRDNSTLCQRYAENIT